MKEKENNWIQVCSKIDKNVLNKYHYTNSLMEEAFQLGMLTMEETANVQTKLMECLVDVIMQKTNGESTSLPVDETKGLMASLIYTLDMYLEQYENPDDAVKALKEEPVKILIQNGTDIISKQYEEIKEMYLYLVKNKLDVPLDCYHSTIDVAVPTFLKSYDIIFAAHVTATTIDYPLAIDDWDICGVKYMYTYMKRIMLETHFVKQFGDKNVEKLLSCFGKAINMDYKLELLNIFELVYNNILYLQLADLEPSKLIFSKEERNTFINQMNQWKLSQVDSYLEEGTKKLLVKLNITDEETVKYIYHYLPNLVKRTKNALQNSSLESLIIAENEEKPKETSAIFQSAEAMDSKAFSKLLHQIEEIYAPEEKAEHIISHIQSVYDLIDIFNSDCLYGDEYEILFSKFQDFELAILVKFVYYEEMRDAQRSLKKIIMSEDWFDYEWKEHFSEYMKGLSMERIGNIEKLLNDIDYEQLKFD